MKKTMHSLMTAAVFAATVSAAAGGTVLAELASAENDITVVPQTTYGPPALTRTTNEADDPLVPQGEMVVYPIEETTTATNEEVALAGDIMPYVTTAEQELELAGPMTDRPHLLHAMANVRCRQNRLKEAADLIFQAGMCSLDDASFIKEALKMMLQLEAYPLMKKLIQALPAELTALPLIKLMKSFALAYTGELEAAEALLMENGGISVPDIREGENSTSQLYLYIQAEKARRNGVPFDASTAQVPYSLDLRMS